MFKVVFLLLLLNQGTHCYTSRSPPVFISQQSNVYIFNQQNLTLSCSIDIPSPTVNYTWFRGNRKLPGSMVNESGSLVIPNITEGEYASREGVDYYCIASDNISFNVAVRSRTITVYYAYFDGFERMAESNESTMEVSIPVAVNSDVALECDVLDAKPRPKIKWYDDQGEIQEMILDNSVRFLDDGRYLYLRRLQPSHLERQYYCSVTNANLIQEISAQTRYVLTDNLTQGVLMDYKQIGNWTAFIGNSSFEFAYVGGVFGSNNINRTSNRLFVNGSELVTLGNVGKITLLSSPGIIQLRAIVRYDSVSVTRNGSVTVHQIPRIINTIQDVREHLVGKGNLTFICQFEGFPLPNITFYHNGAIVSPGNGVKITGNNLTIPSPQVSHSGIYQCIVSNEFGDDQIAWFLEIRQPISPKVKNHTQLGALDRDVGVLIVESINSTASFFVDIEAYPCPSVAWSFNGIALGPTNNTFTYNNPCLEASDRSLIWTFTLNVVLTSATSGQYMADFTNINGTTSLRGPYITVPSPASILSLNLSEACLKQGSNVSLRCYTDGYPRPNIEFLQNSVTIMAGEPEFKNFVQEYFDELVITDVTMKDGGRYSCSVPELPVPQQVTQQYDYCTMPRITGLNSVRNPQIGGLLTIECMFEGTPAPYVTWRKGQEVIRAGDGRYQIVNNSAMNSSSLEASITGTDFNGLYECVVTNDAGSDCESIEIKLNAAVSLSRGAIAGIFVGVLVSCILVIFLVIVILVTVYCVNCSKVKDKGKLTIRDLKQVRDVVWKARVKWYFIGLWLDINVDDLDVIEKKYKGDIDKCFVKCLSHWLRREDPPATWSAMVVALTSPAVYHTVIAEEIKWTYMSTTNEEEIKLASTKTSMAITDILTIQDLKQILEVVWETCSKWIMIGLYLGIESDFLDVIRINNNGDINHCFVKLLTLWLKRADPPATWLALIEALEGIDNDMVAERIRSTYILSAKKEFEEVKDEDITLF